MKYDLSYLEDKECFLIKDYGKTDPNVIEAALKEMLQSDHWHFQCSIIFDCSEEDLSALNTTDVQFISMTFTQYNKELEGCRIAIIMTQDLSFGMGRMWEAFTQNRATFEVQICRNLDEADQWITKNNETTS